MVTQDTGRILVIEDNEMLRTSIMEILTFENFTVRGAENGVVGLQQIYQFRPQVIICDVMMPEMDGYDVLKHVREGIGLPSTRFVFLTAKTEREDVRHGMEYGADDYLTKPFSAETLLRTIGQQFQRYEAQEANAQQRLDVLRGQLVTSLPHEFRTPLTSLIGFTDLLLEMHTDLSPEQFRDVMLTMKDAALRMWRLVENYLLYNQIRMSDKDARFLQILRSQSTANCAEVIEQEVNRAARKYQRMEDIRASYVPDVLDQSLPIEDKHLAKIVYELMDNALKFSPAGSPVTVETQRNDGQWLLCITDAGRGMSAEAIEQIGAYVQFERGRYEQQGSGLGLVIARELSQLHGGQLHIESQSGGPTRVTVSLPIRITPIQN
jgi:signal transduction histidine kinase